jgi:hypothetical protein
MSLLKSDVPIDFLKLYAGVIAEIGIKGRSVQDSSETDTKSLKLLASEVLELLETKVGASEFIVVYSEVQKKIQNKKQERKRCLATEAIRDPRSFASKKVRQLVNI